MQSIKNAEIKGQKVIVRVDYNEPIKDGRVCSNFRIKSSIQTIDYLIKNGVKEIILVSHLGRPEGIDQSLSMKPIAEKLSEIVNCDLEIKNSSHSVRTIKIEEFEGFEITDKIKLLENIRFYPEEEAGDQKFAEKLSRLGNLFIFEAFGVANDQFASTTGLAKILPTFLGFQVQKEIQNLTGLLSNHEKPFVIILGGAKTADKLPLIKHLIKSVDVFLIGGAIANTFLISNDKEVGKSLVDESLIEEALIIAESVLSKDSKDLYLPVDFVVSKSIEKSIDVKIKDRQTIEFDDIIVDIGPQTRSLIIEQIMKAKTIFFNGNMGVSEIKEFSDGTREIAEAIVKSDAKKIVGGGDTVAFLETNKMLNKFDFVSTGGGATLAYLAGSKMPILEIVQTKSS